MRLYSLSVLYRGDPKVRLLKAAYDVSTFSFFQRSRWVREHPGTLGEGRGVPGALRKGSCGPAYAVGGAGAPLSPPRALEEHESFVSRRSSPWPAAGGRV